MAYGAKIRASKPYWSQRCGELVDMIEQLGMPTVFLTLSAADYHWPDQFRFIDPLVDFSTLTERDRKALNHDNPDKVDFFFVKRAELFIDYVLKPIFGLKDMWHRFEWQWRRSCHLHGLFWFEGAPNLDKVEFSEVELEEIRVYFDRLCTAVDPNADLPPAEIHPSRKRFSEVADDNRLQDLTDYQSISIAH